VSALRPAVFLDRDGTLIQEAHYLADPDRVRLIAGAAGALERLRAAGYALVLVTNQSGIARGIYSAEDYHAVAARLDEVLEQSGVPVDGTYYCMHHPDYSGPCDCRKPGTGMYERAARELGLDPAASWYVGDKVTDVLPAEALGGKGVLVRTGYGQDHEKHLPLGVVAVDDLAAAAALILTS
jgi:D-glycero-D-manno-heptose 1,7-bisphosphate phosphatase